MSNIYQKMLKDRCKKVSFTTDYYIQLGKDWLNNHSEYTKNYVDMRDLLIEDNSLIKSFVDILDHQIVEQLNDIGIATSIMNTTLVDSIDYVNAQKLLDDTIFYLLGSKNLSYHHHISQASTSQQRYFVVFRGKVPGIYNNPDLQDQMTQDYPDSLKAEFDTYSEAFDAFKEYEGLQR